MSKPRRSARRLARNRPQQRAALEQLLASNRSMRSSVGAAIAEGTDRARRLAAEALDDHGVKNGVEADSTFTEEQVLGEWLP